MRSAMERISKIVGGRERWVFMSISIKNGITITINDDELVSWEKCKKNNACYFILRDGSRWVYYKNSKFFLQIYS